MKLEKWLLRCSRHMSAHANFCLLTLLLLSGLTFGLWAARSSARDAGGMPATRGQEAAGLCTHAAVAFDPQMTLQQLGRLLRAQDAYILYGPDEFGEYQIRFAAGTLAQQALTGLRARAEVIDVRLNAQCL